MNINNVPAMVEFDDMAASNGINPFNCYKPESAAQAMRRFITELERH